MQYLGGKKKQAAAIAAFLESRRRDPSQLFVDLFCGSAAIVAAMTGPRAAYDASQGLITLYQRMQNGWDPPYTLSEETYKLLRRRNDLSDPLTAFAGHGCSYGGKLWGGYARDPKEGRNFAATARASLRGMIYKTRGVPFACCDYRDAPIPDGALVYCDPPYLATTSTYASPVVDIDLADEIEATDFDSVAFWRWAELLSRRCDVFVSEYIAPPPWRVAWSSTVRKSRLAGVRVERIFETGGRAP